MIVKGIVSAIDTVSNKASVILPEYDIVTRPISAYPVGSISNLKVNDFVLVVVFMVIRV